MTLLVFHIISGMVLVGASMALTIGAVLRRKVFGARGAVLGSFSAVTVSGVVLVAFGADFGHFCVSMLSLSAFALAAYVVYARRMATIA